MQARPSRGRVLVKRRVFVRSYREPGVPEGRGIFLSVMGKVVQLVFDDLLDDRIRDRAREAWSGATVAEAKPHQVVTVEPGLDGDRLLEALSSRVTLAGLAEHKGETLTFHAAGLALDDGRVVGFVGPSGRGKTTLCRLLGARYGYVTDETVAVAPDRTVHPYRKPLSLKRDGAPKRQVAPEEAGMRELPDSALRLAGLVLLDRAPDVADMSIERVPLIEAMVGLLPEMSYMASFDDPLVRLAALCEQIGGVVRLTYADVSQLDGILEQLVAPGTFEETWTRVHDMAAPPHDYEIADVLDAVQCGDEIIAISNQQIRVLAGIAPTIWVAVRDGRSFHEIVLALVDRFGDPGEGNAAELARRAINSLIEARLLRAVQARSASGEAGVTGAVSYCRSNKEGAAGGAAAAARVGSGGQGPDWDRDRARAQ